MTVQSTSRLNPSSTLLRRTLQVDGLSSALIGIMMAAGAGPTAALMGLDSPPALAVMGIVLVAHGIILFTGANRERVDPRLTWYTIIGNVAWLVGSAVILLTGILPLTVAGWWIIAIVADIVTVYVVLQFIGLRRQQ